MAPNDLLSVLLHGNQLKRTARTGWTQRGVPNPENVAAHSYGVAFAALLLTPLVGQTLDSAKVLTMALLHDLAEGLTTDIPTPAWRYLPPDIKSDVERGAMQEILGEGLATAALMIAWEELHENETAEARLVHDADKIDLYLQAFIYEEQTGNRHLQEFWAVPYRFYFPEAQAIYDALRQKRDS
jgi:putative hydrolase of HD superfamily